MLASLLLAAGAGCVPVKTTYYEAVDRPWAAAFTEGSAAKCPPTYYAPKVGASQFVVRAMHRGGKAQIAVGVRVAWMEKLAFKSWNVRLTSVSDPTIQLFVPLRFSGECGRLTDCPVPADTNTLAGSESGPPKFDRYFNGLADVPPELVAGFLVELPEVSDGTEQLDARPMKFELRSRVLVKGLHGCE